MQRIITYRPLPESGMLMMKQWLQNETWQQLYQLDNAHQKAELFHNTLLEKLDFYLPEKNIKLRAGDRAWISNKIQLLDRRRKREYKKRKKSKKWKWLNNLFLKKCKKAIEK